MILPLSIPNAHLSPSEYHQYHLHVFISVHMVYCAGHSFFMACIISSVQIYSIMTHLLFRPPSHDFL